MQGWVAKDKAAAHPVDVDCTYCCKLVELDRADFGRTEKGRHSALLTEPGLVHGPGLGLPELVAC